MNLTKVTRQIIIARQEGLVVKEMQDEMLVYDLQSHQAHCLNKTAAFIWEHCDGETTIEELAKRMSEEWHTPVEVNSIWLCLKQLEQAKLLQTRLAEPEAG